MEVLYRMCEVFIEGCCRPGKQCLFVFLWLFFFVFQTRESFTFLLLEKLYLKKIYVKKNVAFFPGSNLSILTCLCSFIFLQRFVYWHEAEGQPVSGRTRIADCTHCLWTTSMRCWKSILWWEGPLRRLHSIDWTVSVKTSF